MSKKFGNHSYIKLVKKQFWTRGVGVRTSWDYVWLLAASEIVTDGHATGCFGYADASEGEQYKYYQQFEESYKTECLGRAKYNSSGYAFDGWLRSGSFFASNCCVLSTSGTLTDAQQSATRGSSPGFCI